MWQQDPGTGKAWSVSSGRLNEHVRRTFERVGRYQKELKPGLHLLRACYATLLLEAGASIETVREILGHCSVVVTELLPVHDPGGQAGSRPGAGFPQLLKLLQPARKQAAHAGVFVSGVNNRLSAAKIRHLTIR